MTMLVLLNWWIVVLLYNGQVDYIYIQKVIDINMYNHCYIIIFSLSYSTIKS